METFTLDRIEGPVAVLIDCTGGILEIPAAHLPAGYHEGAVLHRQDGLWLIDPDATIRRRISMQEKLEKLLSKNK